MSLQEVQTQLNELTAKFDFLLKALNVPLPNSEPLIISDVDSTIEKYRKFLIEERKVTELTVKNRLWHVRAFLENYPRITPEVVKLYFDEFQLEVNRFNLRFRAIVPFLRDFSKRPDLVQGLKMQAEKMKLIKVPTIEQIRIFYAALPEGEIRVLFLCLATSGLRLGEVLALRVKDVNLSTGKLDVSWIHVGQTKHSNFSFVNPETLKTLRPLLSDKGPGERVFLAWEEGEHYVDRLFREASERSGVKICPKDLRSFFASEMDNRGLPESKIDFVQGRLPRKVIRRHYLDYTDEKIQKLYQRANLTILC